MRSLLWLVLVVGCSKEPTPDVPDVAPKIATPSPSPSPPPAVSSAPAPKEESTPALTVCKKLEASGAVTGCRISGNSARFGDDAMGGVVSAFDDAKSLEGVVKAMAKDKSNKSATSQKALVLVMWKAESSAETDKKIRAAVAAL